MRQRRSEGTGPSRSTPRGGLRRCTRVSAQRSSVVRRTGVPRCPQTGGRWCVGSLGWNGMAMRPRDCQDSAPSCVPPGRLRTRPRTNGGVTIQQRRRKSRVAPRGLEPRRRARPGWRIVTPGLRAVLCPARTVVGRGPVRTASRSYHKAQPCWLAAPGGGPEPPRRSGLAIRMAPTPISRLCAAVVRVNQAQMFP